jgi:hypothetical protein
MNCSGSIHVSLIVKSWTPSETIAADKSSWVSEYKKKSQYLEEAMLKKITFVLSVLAALGFAVAISAPADAKSQGNKGGSHTSKSVHVNKSVHVKKNVNVQRKVHVNKNVQVNKQFVVGKKYNGHVWYGHRGHRWRGVWYAYGVGPCWINVGGQWFWNVVACPI